MKINILVEGSTEESFIKNVLAPILTPRGIYIIPTIITTKVVKNGPNFKGGVLSYEKVKKQILRLLDDSSAAVVTTMIDYYALPETFPGKGSLPTGRAHQKVEYLEGEWARDINNPKFIPYFSLHEFEALLFSSPGEIARTLTNLAKINELNGILISAGSPEEINDDPTTCPSARLERLFPEYIKPLYGTLISKRIGLNTIRERCVHFNNWIRRLENLN